MPKVSIFKDRRADILLGRAKMTGLDVGSLSKKSGISKSTIYRRLKNPNDITLLELRLIHRAINLSDEELLYFIKLDWRKA